MPVLVSLTSVLFLLLLSSAAPVFAQSEGWTDRVLWRDQTGTPVAAIHITLLPDRRLLGIGAGIGITLAYTPVFTTTIPALGQPLPSELSVYNMGEELPYAGPLEGLFCTGQTLLADGRLFAAGGSTPTLERVGGLPYALIYDGNGWSRTADMVGLGAEPSFGPTRWYPAVTRLADSRILVTAGSNYTGGPTTPDSKNLSVEVYDPLSGLWSLVSPQASSPSQIFNVDYSHVFQLPVWVNGHDVLIFGQDGYPVLLATPDGSWKVRAQKRRPGTNDAPNHGASTLLLPLRVADGEWGYRNGSVLMAGGEHGSPNEVRADVYDPVENKWKKQRELGVVRHDPSTVLLPDGRILVVAGLNDELDPDVGRVQYIDPADNFAVTWGAGAYSEVRGYHTVAVLLPDGRILVGGGSTTGQGGDEHPDFRLFEPAYVFASRPVITSTPATFDYGTSSTVTWTGGTPVTEVVLIALGSMTHAVDMNQRYVQLQITASGSGSTTVLAPPNSMVAPAGDYMLFVLDQNRIPSEARIVGIGGALPPPCEGAPNGTSCSDGNACNGEEACQNSICEAGTPLICDDGDLCTTDLCYGESGCAYLPDGAAEDCIAAWLPAVLSVLEPDVVMEEPVICGNGVVEAGEDCDDGNTPSPSGCCVDCAFAADGTSCVGESLCLLNPVCGSGECVGTPQPEPSCRGAERSSLALRNRDFDPADYVNWKWTRGQATDPAALGDPIDGSTRYSLCIFDETAEGAQLAMEAALPPQVECSGRRCWKSTSTTLKFTDSSGQFGGIYRLILKSGAAGRAKVILKGRGIHLGAPQLPLAQQPGVHAQLRNSDGECWGSSFDTPARVNDDTQFKDRH